MDEQANGWPGEATELQRTGGCNCGAVRLRLRGTPMRAGLCHCLTCRKETGSPFMSFGIWLLPQTTITGEVRSWSAGTDRRHFCPRCGSTLYGTVDGTEEVEVRLGTLDEAPADLAPEYELWTGRREPWLSQVPGAAQHPANRPEAA